MRRIMIVILAVLGCDDGPIPVQATQSQPPPQGVGMQTFIDPITPPPVVFVDADGKTYESPFPGTLTFVERLNGSADITFGFSGRIGTEMRYDAFGAQLKLVEDQTLARHVLVQSEIVKTHHDDDLDGYEMQPALFDVTFPPAKPPRFVAAVTRGDGTKVMAHGELSISCVPYSTDGAGRHDEAWSSPFCMRFAGVW